MGMRIPDGRQTYVPTRQPQLRILVTKQFFDEWRELVTLQTTCLSLHCWTICYDLYTSKPLFYCIMQLFHDQFVLGNILKSDVQVLHLFNFIFPCQFATYDCWFSVSSRIHQWHWMCLHMTFSVITMKNIRDNCLSFHIIFYLERNTTLHFAVIKLQLSNCWCCNIPCYAGLTTTFETCAASWGE